MGFERMAVSIELFWKKLLYQTPPPTVPFRIGRRAMARSLPNLA
jgi:hypothetical protein